MGLNELIEAMATGPLSYWTAASVVALDGADSISFRLEPPTYAHAVRTSDIPLEFDRMVSILKDSKEFIVKRIEMTEKKVEVTLTRRYEGGENHGK